MKTLPMVRGPYLRRMMGACVTMALLTGCTQPPTRDESGATSGPTAASAAAAPGTPPTGAVYGFAAGHAGSVILTLRVGQVTVDAVEPATGWSIVRRDERANATSLEFAHAESAQRAAVEATIDGEGGLHIRTELVGPARAGAIHAVPAGEAGLIRLRIGAAGLAVQSVEPAPTFEIAREIDARDSRAAIELINETGLTHVGVVAEITGRDRLKVTITTVIDTGFGQSPHPSIPLGEPTLSATPDHQEERVENGDSDSSNDGVDGD